MTLHGIAHAESFANGDAGYACWCRAWFLGPMEEAAEAYRRHMAEPAYPSTGRQS